MCGPYLIRRLMREQSLLFKQPGPHKYQKATAERPDIPDCLSRLFDVAAPNQVCAGDIVYI